MVWVVETGIPKYSETYNETAPAVSAATPSNGVTLVILVPIVFTILQPPLIVPKAIKKNDANGTQPQDRKSTRLNSSHVRISYAVFCLKKKKKNKTKDTCEIQKSRVFSTIA